MRQSRTSRIPPSQRKLASRPRYRRAISWVVGAVQAWWSRSTVSKQLTRKWLSDPKVASRRTTTPTKRVNTASPSWSTCDSYRKLHGLPPIRKQLATAAFRREIPLLPAIKEAVIVRQQPSDTVKAEARRFQRRIEIELANICWNHNLDEVKYPTLEEIIDLYKLTDANC